MRPVHGHLGAPAKQWSVRVARSAVEPVKKDEMEDGEIKPQSVDYGKVTPLLVRAVQELIAKVEALENA